MSAAPENPLEAALVRAATDVAARQEFYQWLLNSPLFVIGHVDRNTPEDPNSGGRLMLATLTYQERDYHPVFASLSRLQAFAQEEVQYVELPGRALFEYTPGANFVLNPGSEIGKELLAPEIAALLGRAGSPPPPTANKPPMMIVGQPAVYPQALVDALCVLFANRADVKAAYLIQIAFEGDKDPPHPLIGVEGSGQWQPVAEEIGRVLKGVGSDTVIDIVPIDRGNPTEIGKALLASTPFYSRNP